MQTVVDLPILLIFVKYIHKVIKGKYKKSMKKLFLLYIYYVSEACLKLKLKVFHRITDYLSKIDR